MIVRVLVDYMQLDSRRLFAVLDPRTCRQRSHHRLNCISVAVAGVRTAFLLANARLGVTGDRLRRRVDGRSVGQPQQQDRLLHADIESVAAHGQSPCDHRRRHGPASATARLGKSSTEVVSEKSVEDRIDCTISVAEQRHHLVQRYRPHWQRPLDKRTDHLQHDGKITPPKNHK